MFMRQWVFKDIKRDRPVLSLVALIDVGTFLISPLSPCKSPDPLDSVLGSGVAWAISLDRKGALCHGPLPSSVRSCHAAPVAVGAVLAWIAAVVGAYHLTP